MNGTMGHFATGFSTIRKQYLLHKDSQGHILIFPGNRTDVVSEIHLWSNKEKEEISLL